MIKFLFRRKKQEKSPSSEHLKKAKQARRKQKVGDIRGNGNTIINGDIE